MKRILLFILPIVIIVAIGFTIFGIFQVRFEEEKMLDDLKRKAKAVAESMELSAKYLLLSNDLRSAQRLVERFQTRERLQGCVIYDIEGKIVAITQRFEEWKEKDKPYVKEILETKTPRGELETFKQYSVYSYVLPVLDDEDKPLGLVEVIYDTAHVFAILTELWRRISITLIIMVIAIALITLLIQRQIFILPVKRLTQWFHYFQKGEIDSRHPIKEKGELGKLASEVEEVALSLRIARRTLSDQASARLEKEEIWTEAKLKNLVQAKLGENAFLWFLTANPICMLLTNQALRLTASGRPAEWLRQYIRSSAPAEGCGLPTEAETRTGNS